MTHKFLIVGTGRAGKARLASMESINEVTGIGLSVRSPNFTADFERHLADPNLSGVIICSANELHYGLAFRSLKARKHTLVEFPLARTRHQCQTLFSLAQRNSVVLHVEFIGLMTGQHLWLSTADLSEVQQVRVKMAGGYYRWVCDDAESGYLGALLVGRLQALHQIWGPLILKDVHFQRFESGHQLNAGFVDQKGVSIELEDIRRPELKRSREISLYGKNGQDVPMGMNTGSPQLFRSDLMSFMAKIDGVVSNDFDLPSDDDILTVMNLADQISALCRSE